MLKIINIDIKPTYEVDNGVLKAKRLGDRFTITMLFDKDGLPTYRVNTSLNNDTFNFPSLADAKGYIERLMLKITLEHIARAAEILEDK